MMAIVVATLIGLLLAYANGANDNFKGVATLLGSKTTNYKNALSWATLCTLLGSLAAIFLAGQLVSTFSGKGLVPDQVVSAPAFSLSVALGAASTVMLATLLGFPISTTHALTGALVGAGWLASATGIHLNRLGSAFFAPLLVSPLISVVGTVVLYPIFRAVRTFLRLERETCLCVGNEVIAVLPLNQSASTTVAALQVSSFPQLRVASETYCKERYVGTVFGMSAAKTLDLLHYLSAGVVSFARGLNDTPKIAALLLAAQFLSPSSAMTMIASAMMIGGLLNSRRVAETVSHRLTSMNHGQGFTANLVTGSTVVLASLYGMPVSTTHVSCGALFGIGTVTKQADWTVIYSVLLAWMVTLPVGAILGGLSFLALKELPL